MKKVTFVISDIDKALAFEWLYDGLHREFDLHYILLNSKLSKLETFLADRGASFERIDYSVGYFKTLLHLRKSLINTRPDVIHCHLRRAELLGIPAAWFIGIKTRVFTRHSSTYNHLYHRKGVLVDKIINRLTTNIIAISRNVEEVLVEKEGVNAKKVVLLHHGFDLALFGTVPADTTEALKNRYHISSDKVVIGIIARYTWWKGFKYIIPALRKYHETFPDAHFVFANAKGNDEKGIKELIEQQLPKECITEIEFEEDVPALYSAFDFYVHVPFDATVEAFGQTYIESLASSVPSVFTLSGIAHEFIEDERNALVVPYCDSDSIFSALKRLREDKTLCNSLKVNGRKDVSTFTLEAHFEKLKLFYNG